MENVKQQTLRFADDNMYTHGKTLEIIFGSTTWLIWIFYFYVVMWSQTRKLGRANLINSSSIGSDIIYFLQI